MRRKKRGMFFPLFFMGLIFVFGFVIWYKYDDQAPTVELNPKKIWNLKENISIIIKDNQALDQIQYSILENNQIFEKVQALNLGKQQKVYKLSLKPKAFLKGKSKAVILVEASDIGLFGFFKNKIVKKLTVAIDDVAPKIDIYGHSYSIKRGGSAIVVWKSTDKGPKNTYIKAAGHKFYGTQFYRPGYYIAFVTWDVKKENFRAMIFAEDKAGNVEKKYVPYILSGQKYYKPKKIAIKDKFLTSKVDELIGLDKQFSSINYNTPLERFIYINTEMRQKNDTLIHQQTSKVYEKKFDGFFLKKFVPLKNAVPVGRYADYRFFTYGGKDVLHTWHLGLDMASVKRAKIVASNKGMVTFSGFNGIYGNLTIVYHQLGLYSIYAHASQLLTKKKQSLKVGDILAETGSTGFAFGDHLHFGILNQGLETNPIEFMDAHWIKTSVLNVIKNAKTIIKQGDE